MPLCKKLKAFLDENRARYVTIDHSLAFTAAEVARSTHVGSRVVVKTVVIHADGRPVMLAVPANQRVNVRKVQEALEVRHATLVKESEFVSLFGDCDLGAMPPFGNLYGMPVVVDPLLARDEEIVFNGGDHLTVVKMAYKDFDRLVHPMEAEITGEMEEDHYWQ